MIDINSFSQSRSNHVGIVSITQDFVEDPWISLQTLSYDTDVMSYTFTPLVIESSDVLSSNCQ